MKHYDVAVIGLGMVGASAVYAAAGAGARVLALDAGPPGGGTSGTSFAWLNSVRKEPDVYHRLNAAGMTAHRELSRELGGDAGYDDGGWLEWADAGDEERELRERVHRLATRGYPAEWISHERASKLEPGLAIPDRVQDIAFFAADAWLDAPRLIGRLLAAAAARGADVREGKAVRPLRARGDRVEAALVGRRAGGPRREVGRCPPRGATDAGRRGPDRGPGPGIRQRLGDRDAQRDDAGTAARTAAGGRDRSRRAGPDAGALPSRSFFDRRGDDGV